MLFSSKEGILPISPPELADFTNVNVRMPELSLSCLPSESN